MSVHRRPSTLRSSTARFAVAGAAGLATLMAAAPMAIADDDLAPSNAEATQTEAPADEPVAEPTQEAPVDEPAEETPSEEVPEETPVEEAPTEEIPAEDEPVEDEPVAASLPKAAALAQTAADDSAESTVDGAEARAADIEPNYGERKIRIGVQLADGSYVTDGTTVGGSTFTLSVKALDGGVTTATCTATGSSGSTYAECGPYYAAPGATVTITQDTVPPGLTKSTEVKTVSPCEEIPDPEQNPDYEDFADIDNCFEDPTYGVPAIFDVTGLLPDTTSDTAGVKSGESVTIDVLANDDSDDPSTSLTIDTPPAHGKAVVTGQAAPQPEPDPEIEFRMGATAVAGAGTLQIVYTADEDFSGTDTFQYAVTNSNGTTTGTVTVAVEGDEVVPPIDEEEPGGTDPVDETDPVVDDAGDEDSADESDESAAAAPTTPATPTSANLPDAGGVDAKLAGYAALLLAGGGGLALAGRRRPGRHTRVS